jgi:hypothetical protein
MLVKMHSLRFLGKWLTVLREVITKMWLVFWCSGEMNGVHFEMYVHSS